jgi:hypothetical protein
MPLGQSTGAVDGVPGWKVDGLVGVAGLVFAAGDLCAESFFSHQSGADDASIVCPEITNGSYGCFGWLPAGIIGIGEGPTLVVGPPMG